ncbi:MAG: TIGR02206 family membrane protein [Phycisphaerales bacterium]
MRGAAPDILASSWHGASWQHLLALGVWAVITFTCVVAARRWRGTNRAEHLRRGLGWFGALAWLTSCGFYLMPERLDLSRSLPLQLCDVAGLLAPVAVLSGRRWARVLLHFWGFGLCTQFFASPVHEPGSAAFVVGWMLHGSIVGLAVFDCAGLGFRPPLGWRDARFAVLAGAAYIAVMFAFNIATGFNYGYVGASKPGAATIVDSLGDWPLRVVWIVLIGSAAVVAVYVVGLGARLLMGRDERTRSASESL